jgi:hypothetical protein
MGGHGWAGTGMPSGKGGQAAEEGFNIYGHKVRDAKGKIFMKKVIFALMLGVAVYAVSSLNVSIQVTQNTAAACDNGK